ncbi:MAG: PilX N-terminal domain-containing pilus assembly protein, partial [Candidatus Rokuibacteriota bacterium]
MNLLRERIDNERGVALPMALICLLVLSGLALAFLTVSAFEPQISENHESGTQARYVAEAGIEWAFDHLVVNAATWNTLLATGGGVIADGQTLPGLGAAFGTFRVT